MAFSDIPNRTNNIDSNIEAEWFNVIKSELIAAFGSGGYIVENSLQTLSSGAEITVISTQFKPLIPVESDGGEVVLSTTPFGTSHGFGGGREVLLLGTSDVNYPVIEVNDIQDGLYNNGKIKLTKGVLVKLIYSSTLERFLVEYN